MSGIDNGCSGPINLDGLSIDSIRLTGGITLDLDTTADLCEALQPCVRLAVSVDIANMSSAVASLSTATAAGTNSTRSTVASVSTTNMQYTYVTHSAIASLSTSSGQRTQALESAIASMSTATVDSVSLVSSSIASLSTRVGLTASRSDLVATNSSIASLSTAVAVAANAALTSDGLGVAYSAIASLSSLTYSNIHGTKSAVASLSSLTSDGLGVAYSAIASLSTLETRTRSSVESLSTGVTAAHSAVSSLSTVVGNLPTASAGMKFAKLSYPAHTNGSPLPGAMTFTTEFDDIGLVFGTSQFGVPYFELPTGWYYVNFNIDFSYTGTPAENRVLLVLKPSTSGYPAGVDGKGEFEINLAPISTTAGTLYLPEGTYEASRMFSVPMHSLESKNRLELALLLMDSKAGWRAGCINIMKLS